MKNKAADESAQPQSPAVAPAIWNLPELLERLDNDRPFLLELLTIFLQDSQSGLQEAKESFARADLSGLERKAHTLKGMMRNLLMDRAGQVASDLEATAHQRKSQESAVLLAQLERAMQELLPEVNAQLAEVKA